MTAMLQQHARPADSNTSVLKRQLVKEIGCLERQIERLRERGQYADSSILATFDAMIGNRRRMLHNLPFEE